MGSYPPFCASICWPDIHEIEINGNCEAEFKVVVKVEVRVSLLSLFSMESLVLVSHSVAGHTVLPFIQRNSGFGPNIQLTTLAIIPFA